MTARRVTVGQIHISRGSRVTSSASGTAGIYPILPTSTSASRSQVETSSSPFQPTGKLSKKEKKIEAAVYSHIKAIRALGRTVINTVEIDESLSLPIEDVNRIVSRLKEKGVRPVV